MAESTTTHHHDHVENNDNVVIEQGLTHEAAGGVMNEEHVGDGKDDIASSISSSKPIVDSNNTAEKIARAKEVYRDMGYIGVVGKPQKAEVWIWYLYEFCSYFIYSFLLPVLFPLMMAQIKLPKEPQGGWATIRNGTSCSSREIELYVALTRRRISIAGNELSPLEWTSVSWGIGLILGAPILAFISIHLDYGRIQLLISGAAIATGAFFCLPTGFFSVTWIFPPYIAAIVASYIIVASSHTRHLGLMVRGFTGPALHVTQFTLRRGVSSWLSLYAAAAGSLGSVIMSSFTYHMLRYQEKFLGLWVVSIFSGLKWAVGISHVAFIKPGPTPSRSISPIIHFFSIFKYPHALGNLVVTFLSSFSTMCIFTTTTLYLIGNLCFEPIYMLYLVLVYYISPVISLPLMQPLQLLLRSNAMKMKLLGLILSMGTSGAGFYFRKSFWHRGQVLAFAAIQSTSVGLLNAYGRVLLIDCSPSGKEGAFSAWYTWFKTLGACIGFAVASSMPGNVSTSFGVAFCVSIAGAVLLVYSNISDSGGAKAAGNVHVDDYGEKGLPVSGIDATSFDGRESFQEETA